MSRIVASLAFFVVASIQVASLSKIAQCAETPFEILHAFTHPPKRPRAALLEGSDGNFYGTTNQGGAADRGTVFKLEPSGELTTLHSFSGGDGCHPYAALMESSDGNFYGTTIEGGAVDQGTVFKLEPSGELTRGCPDPR